MDARKAAEEQYPIRASDDIYSRRPVDVRRAYEKGYEAGQAARTPQITAGTVRAVWNALGSGATVHLEYEELRAALEAALGQTNETTRGIDRSDPRQRAEYLAASRAEHILGRDLGCDTKEETA